MSGSETPSYASPNLSLPYTVPGNTPPELVPLFKPLYMAFQNIIQTLITYCGIAPRSPQNILSSINDPSAFLSNNVHRFYTTALEPIGQGALVNLTVSTGNVFAQNANAVGKQADGFCSQSGGLLTGAVGEFILGDGMITTGISGLTPGTRYYLSTTNGQLTSVAPTASGNIAQSVGIAISSTTFRFILGPLVQH